jgi:hypothetical protein
MRVASRVHIAGERMLAITPCRDGISDRFPHAALVVRVPANRWFEIAIATDPRLLLPAHRHHRRADNFATSRADGLLRAPGGAATYLVPPEQLRRFVGARRLYFAIGSYRTPDGNDPVLTIDDRLAGVASIRIGGDFTGRTLPVPRVAARAVARYGAGGGDDVLAWGGDAVLGRRAAISRGLDLGVRAFPSRYADPFTADARLQACLDEAFTDMRATFPTFAARRLPLALVALADDGANQFAANLPDDMDFIASLAKVSALYASYELRRAVTEVARNGAWSTAAELWQLLNRELDPQITSAVASIPDHAAPRYREIFDLDRAAANPGTGVDFTDAYKGWLDGMIAHGQNGPSGECIRRLGFQYINGALAAGGFFDAGTGVGSWLTGDFVNTPLRLADSKNDQLVGQAGTPRTVAKMFTLLGQRAVVDFMASDEMLALLHASLPNDPPWISRVPGVGYSVQYNKLGKAPLKPANGGMDVYSEGTVLRHSGRWFAVAWQNVIWTDDGFAPVARLIDRAITRFLTP